MSATAARLALLAALATAVAASPAASAAAAITPPPAADPAPPSSFDVDDRPGTSRKAFEERVTTILTQRLESVFTGASYRWIACPPEAMQYAREWGDHDVACQAEVGDRTTRRAVRIAFRYRDPGWSPEPEPMTYRYASDGPFRVAPRRCSRRPYAGFARRASVRLAAFGVEGGWDDCALAATMLTRVVVRRLDGPSSFVLWSDRTFIDRAFPQRSRFVCRHTGRRLKAVRCHNALGHAWTAKIVPLPRRDSA